MKTPVYKRLAKLVLRYWPYLLGSSLAALVFVTLNSFSIWLTASLVNNILNDFDSISMEQLAWAQADQLTLNERLKYIANQLILQDSQLASLRRLCLIIFGVFLFKNIFLYIKNILVSYVQFSLIVRIRNMLYGHIHTLSMSYFNRKKSGELTSIMMNDVNVMQDAFTTTFQKLLVEPLNILFFGTILFIIDWKLSFVALLTLPLAGFLYVSVGVSIRRKSKRIQEKIASIMHILTEVLYSIRVIKAFVTKRYEIQKFEKEGNRYFHLLFRRAKLDNLATPINEIIGVLIGVVLLWYGGMQVIQTETLTSEDFLRFILVLFAMLAPIKTLGTVNITIQNSLAAAERVFNILDSKPDINDKPDAKEIESFSEEIRFDNVSFDYGEESVPVLKNVSFSISKGSVVALVGASGAGKSTIADLIPRFYDTTSGYVKIDGEDIREIKLESLRRMMGVVSQEIILFNDTVKQNIAYGQEEIKDSNIISAAKAANAMGFIKELPNGLDTIIGERGVKISGGQKQRLSIARAIIKNPSLLILDEATSSLDTESEKLVQEAIEKLMKDRTVLVIAHRLSTVKNADNIIVLEQGKIIEKGNHVELIDKKGKYSELYAVQFQNERKN
tara:strand:+ start:928 stop:2775 length:1848 start_codon:yes stop_codon:yes gene_type:complete